MKRSVFYLKNNMVEYMAVDESGFKLTSAEAILEKIWNNIYNIIIFYKK